MSILQIETAPAYERLLGKSRYKGAHGGRGSAKSHFFAELAVERSILDQTDIVCVREIQRSLDQSVKKLLEIKIQNLNAGAYFDVQDRRIRSFPNGRRKDGETGLMIFEGLQNHTVDSIKSLEGYDVLWGEEAHSLSQRSVDIIRPTIRKPGSELWFSWNPDLPTDPIDALLRGQDCPPDSVVIEVNYMDNPWFPDVLQQEMLYDKKRDYDKYLHVWMGGYRKNSEARVFKNWRVDEFMAPEGVTRRQGADWGFSVDPSVLVTCYLVGRTLFIDYEAYMVGCEIDMLPDLFDRVPESRKWFITADSARPETISYMQKHGYPRINAAVKGAGSLEDGIEFMKSFDIVVHPRCVHTIDELTNYSYKLDPLTGLVLPVLEDKHNHVIDSCRYAIEGVRKTQELKKKERGRSARPPLDDVINY